jgi:hypothetical protein
MRELAKIKYGSHLYGTNTEKSDVDWKVIYLPDLKPLLLGDRIANTFTSTSGSDKTNTKDDVDVEYVPLQKLVRDFYAGQTYALEVIFGIKCDRGVEVNDVIMYEVVDTLFDQFLTNKVDSMVGYAMSQSYKYGIKGKRYEAINRLNGEVFSIVFDCEIEDKNQPISKYFNKITTDDSYVRIEDGNLLVLDKVYQGTTHIFEIQDRVKAMLAKFGERTKQTNINGDKDWKSISHAVRISMMALDLLSNGKLVFPLPQEQVDLVKDIKGGRVPWDTVEQLICTLQDGIECAKHTTKLPKPSNSMETMLDDKLYRWLLAAYGINT